MKKGPRKVFLFISLFLFFLLLAASLYTYITLTRPFPRTEGTITLEGLSAPVTVRRNADGVPHITATTTEDLFFAQGFVHAQDRLFQMDVQRRTGLGTLSALIGHQGLPSDRLARSLNLRDTAGRLLADTQAYAPELIPILTAYSAGVNAFVASGSPPAEHQWLDSDWESWQPLDSFAIYALYDYQVGSGAERSWIRPYLYDRVGENNADFLYGFVRRGARAWTPLEETGNTGNEPFLPPSPDWHVIPTEQNSHVGWFIPAEDTLSQKPIMGSTLTLGTPLVPNPWYINALASPTHSAVGASFAGTPLVISGYNDAHTWTWQGQPENQHLIRWDGARTLVSHSFSTLQVEPQTIPVHRGEPVAFDRLYTDAGPILAEVGSYYSVYSEPHFVAEWLSATSDLNRPDSTLLFTDTLYAQPHYAWMYDKTGGYGYDYSPDHPSHLNAPVAISDVITSLQVTFDPNAARWIAALNAVPSDNIVIQRAQEQLAAWNGEMRADLPGATLYRVVRAFTLREMLNDELGHDLAPAYLSVTDGEHVDRLLDDPDHPLWDDLRTPVRESRDTMIARAWDDAHHYLARRFGDVPHEWEWGRLHYLTLRHPLADQFPLLDRLLTRTVPLPGDASTALPIPDDPTLDFAPAAVPSLRVVLSPGGDFYFAYPGGQSAHPFHPNANTFLDAWASGDLVKLEWNGTGDSVLELTPQ